MNISMNKALSLIHAVLLLVVAVPAQALETPQLRVLFLGDNDIHKPIERFNIVKPVLAKQGIEVVYTDDMRDISAAKLAGFDALAIYANITEIAPAQETALLEFVEGGGGLVAIHCASFLNSPKYVRLVGAKFESHGQGVFREVIVEADHPVMRGLTPIESWNETYIHAKFSEDRTVLAERRDDKGNEPWTWVREFGNGRVFYTAWGHDERTWSTAGFQALIENGIRWAAENSPNKLKPHTGLKAFEFAAAADAMPNYTPGEKWGTEGEQIKTMQKPLNPKESAKHFVTLSGFEHHLFASEPDIYKPIWLAFDERGRLWIAETKDYPNEMQPENMGRDRLKIVEDTDGDGKADKFTVFVDKLSVPTSFLFSNDGVIVIHSGRTEFFKDTDGDDRADESKILFTGWGTRDTHATASNLRYGFDNWVWGTVGYSGFEGTVGGKEHRFGQGIFRFKPDGSAMEFMRSSNNNTWGLAFTEDNIAIGSTANGNASMYLPIPNRYYEAVNGWSAARLESIADSQNFYPITDKIRQVDWHAKYTAGSGSAVYTARSFPKHFWNRAQFVAEPTGHVLGLFYLERRGADFVAHNARNFAASDDEWSSPIYGEVGPDGALWMVDWYNYIIQHNPTPVGFKTGKGNAYETPLRDKVHGRIYRITHKDGKPSTMPVLSKDNPQGLLSALSNDNLFWRMHAQRLIVERGNTDVALALSSLVEDTRIDELGLSPAATHALWTLHGLQVVNDVTREAFMHPTPSVRRAGFATMPRDEAAANSISNSLEDIDAQARLAALLALSDMPASEKTAKAILTMLGNSSNSGDRWIREAAVAAAAQNAESFLATTLSSSSSEELVDVVGLVATHYAQSDSPKPLQLLKLMDEAPTSLSLALLDSFISSWPEDRAPKFNAEENASLSKLMDAVPEATGDRLLSLMMRWGLKDRFEERYVIVTNSLRNRVSDTSIDDAQRAGAARRWVGLQDESETIETILQQVTLLAAPDLANGLLTGLTQSKSDDVGTKIVKQWATFTPAVKRTAINVLMRRSEWTRTLLDAIENEEIAKADLAPEHWVQLKSNPSRRISGMANRLAEVTAASSEERQQILDRLLPLAKEKGDAAHGKEVFKTSCAVCHAVNGEGGKIGPELTGIGARDRTEILQEILDPNRSVEDNYRLWTVTTKDDAVFAGRLEAESQTTIEILDLVSQKQVIQRSNIKSLRASPLSLMPAGFEALPADDLKGLLEYLSQSKG
jgi:uncharacterized protein